MRRWLVTTSIEEDLDQLRQVVETCGGVVKDAQPVPLEGGEQVFEVEGPNDLPEKLEKNPAVRKVSPDSDIEFYPG